MLKSSTCYTYTLPDGETIVIPEYVVNLYRAHKHYSHTDVGDVIALIKWLRVSLNLGLADAKRLHDALITATLPPL